MWINLTYTATDDYMAEVNLLDKSGVWYDAIDTPSPASKRAIRAWLRKHDNMTADAPEYVYACTEARATEQLLAFETNYGYMAYLMGAISYYVNNRPYHDYMPRFRNV